MIFHVRKLSSKLALKRNFFGAVSGKFMRQIEKLLAHILPAFRRHILSVFGS
ncbi:hypothetical protein C7382_103152 [Porphyromonas loveana]|uniref:Uncharacterized protein n=1 Tax=Porphyromonas loveana TaxID=1884669 RepID=A0A2U1FMM9_9PORP|nr:hypothetical protein C7382_103152 [Porphyromonas loveana]